MPGPILQACQGKCRGLEMVRLQAVGFWDVGRAIHPSLGCGANFKPGWEKFPGSTSPFFGSHMRPLRARRHGTWVGESPERVDLLHPLGQLCSTFFISWHIEKALKWSRHPTSCLPLDKAHHAAGGFTILHEHRSCACDLLINDSSSNSHNTGVQAIHGALAENGCSRPHK